MSITISASEDVIKEIDRLREPELLTRSQWLRREVTQPGTKPDVVFTLTQEKEQTAARQERRRERVADATIPATDIRKLTRKRQDDGPGCGRFQGRCPTRRTMSLRTAQGAYAKMKNVESGHELAKEIGYQNPVSDDYAQASRSM
jgi:hypothetical protein